MTGPGVVRVALVQATPVVLDADATVAKACRLIEEAGDGGARLVALPEAFVSLYPSSRWAYASARWSAAATELHRRMWEGAVDVPGPLTARLGAAARRAGAWVAVGVNERDPARPGTLWNSLLWFGPDGRLAHRHRKLIPTLHERVFWGQGAGDDLDPIATEIGRLGGLICWENFMPAARARLHRGGCDFHLAPTADDRDIWVAAMRTFAFEAGAYVLSPVQYLRRDAFPDDFPFPDELAACPDELLVGNSVIVDPGGTIVAGPVAGREEILYADCDHAAILAARRVFDVAGHYSRPDLEPV
ncbi:carbon-nitrogen hydrolase family protein [Miltoncostaea oceani]|uniref:carbon-nitrogen hydrolase family protein n=1 Tax=Miltoncostaea oceani TaxID=2843216 RepID=UPI001C3E027C|nr:carbon-nitrogen hydrolase family protein [Miltoncostaea oceani]